LRPPGYLELLASQVSKRFQMKLGPATGAFPSLEKICMQNADPRMDVAGTTNVERLRP